MNFLAQALKALPTIAMHPLAFAGYAVVIGAWLAAYWRTRRCELLMKHIKQLPEKDRKGAIQLEFNAVLPSTIDAEQWLRGQRQKYYLIAFVVTVVSGVVFAGFVFLTRRPGRKPPVSSGPRAPAIHVSIAGGIYSLISRQPNQLTAVAVIAGNSVTPIDMLNFITIANRQNIPMKVQRFWWKDQGRELCLVSALAARLYWLNSSAGIVNGAVPLNLDNSLESALTTSAIQPHQFVSGWALWECPVGWCFPGRTFGVEEAEGHRFTVSPELQQGQAHSLGTVPSFLHIAGKAVGLGQFGKLKIQECK
jgi:hypothetical protein